MVGAVGSKGDELPTAPKGDEGWEVGIQERFLKGRDI